MTSQANQLTVLDNDVIATVTGGAAQSQAELRQLAQQHCPTTAAKFARTSQVTRQMGEACLDEAGLGMFKSRLDQYFPRK